MKRKLLLTLLAVILSILPTFVNAVTVIDGIYYDLITSNKTAEVRGGGSYSGDIIIPESVQYNNEEYSVTSIGYSAFSGCSGLTSVNIPNSVTSIGPSAFRYCSGLTSVTIPNSMTSIGSYAFESCSGLTSVTIPNSVTSIGYSAFSGCSGLTSVTIPNSVTSIGDGAFKGCSGLTSVTIPSSVTSIGSSAFEGCNGLTSIVVESGNSVYNSRNNCNAIIKTATNILICGCKTTIIPNSVTSIGLSAFRNCSGLTLVTIPNSVTYIGSSAFEGCSGLTSVTIPNSVTSIDSYVFSGCSGLTSITIPNSVTSIGSYAFEGCSGLTSVTIPNSVKSVDDAAFFGCNGLTSVTIPNSVTSIGSSAFGGCSGLTSVTIPNSVTYIGSSAFKGCSGLTSVTIPNSVTYIGSYAFEGCSGLTSVTIPNSVTSIGSSPFEGCSGLTSIEVESGNTKYDSRNNCNAIIESATNNLICGCKNTTIPNSVTSIGSSAFLGCSGLTSVTIPNSVTSIGSYAFMNCSGLTSVITEKETPVSIYSSVFSNRANAKLYVPKGAKTAYAAANYWTEFKAIKEFPVGDINEDGETNVEDVVYIACYVVGQISGEVIRHLADVDNSNSVTIADAIVLVNDIAGDTSWAKPMMAQSRVVVNDVLKLVSTDGNNLSLQMDGNGQYAAFQFDLWLPENMDVMDMTLNNERRQGHQLLYNKVGDGHYRVVALSTAANSFNGTSGELLDMILDGFATDDIRVDGIRFVTPYGSEKLFDALGVTHDGIATPVNDINVDGNSDKRTVYNLNGQQIHTPQKGVHVINGRKVVVK